MDSTTTISVRYEQFKTRLVDRLKRLPFTQNYPIDISAVLVLLTVQIRVIPKGWFGSILIDLITPWIVVGFIIQPFRIAAVVAIVAALGLESHSSVPAGQYMACFCVIGCATELVKSTLSWRQDLTWISALLVCQTWVISFELFTITKSQQIAPNDLTFYLQQLVRLILSCIFGYLLANRWILEKRREARRLDV